MQQTLRIKEEDHHKEEEELTIWDCGSPLYDSYELASISHLIERHLMALPSLGRSRRFTNFSHHSSADMASLNSTVSSDMRSSSTTRGAKESSSMVASLREFVGIRRIWKRRVVLGEGKDKTKKMKTGFSGFCNMIGLWRQKDQYR